MVRRFREKQVKQNKTKNKGNTKCTYNNVGENYQQKAEVAYEGKKKS